MGFEGERSGQRVVCPSLGTGNQHGICCCRNGRWKPRDDVARWRGDLGFEDERVKAVVIRVNSPGGDGLASEVMLREVERTPERRRQAS